MKWCFIALVAALVLTLGPNPAQGQRLDPATGAKQITTQINGQRIWQFTRYLASDELAGRLAGTEGGR
ncbi:MAG: hypothetical protein GWN58_18075, partial [Anaerolineae bacterium]|nr:hypothetical protein [Anaerolineae bacterium]